MSKFEVKNAEGKQVAEAELADAVYGIEPNIHVMHHIVKCQQACWRQGTQSTKGRSEVSGGGKKPWRQKGTGRARQGSIRAPQWRGGGIAFGPTPRSYAYRLNRKVRRLALRSLLSEKVIENNLVVVDALKFDAIKTKEFVKVMDAFKFEGKTLFVADIAEDFDNAFMSLRNIPNAALLTVEELNAFDIANAQKLVMTEAAANKAGEVFA